MSLSLYPLALVSNYILSKDKNIPFAIIQLIFVMMPTLGYVDQLVNMIKTCKFHIFKIDLFLIVFSASILKVVYWFLSPYSSTLFFQAIALALVQLVLAFFHFKYKNYSISHSSPSKLRYHYKKNTFNIRQILNLNESNNFFHFSVSILTYIIAIFAFIMILWLIFGKEIVSWLIGLSANIIDTSVSIPNIKSVIIEKDKSVSIVLLVQFFIGDVFKNLISFFSQSPMPLIVGGVIQLLVDGAVLFVYFQF